MDITKPWVHHLVVNDVWNEQPSRIQNIPRTNLSLQGLLLTRRYELILRQYCIIIG